MMLRVTENDRRTLLRVSLIIIPPNEASTPEVQLLKNRIRGFRPAILRELDGSSAELAMRSDRIIPLIQFDFHQVPGQKKETEAYLAAIPADLASKVRIVIDLNEMSEEAGPAILSKYGISHLIAIRITQDLSDVGVHASPQTTTIRADIKEVNWLIHDVLLDIAMFHSFPHVERAAGQSLLSRIDFSLKKVQFANERQLRSTYGVLPDTNALYFSFAAACRRRNGFLDLERYEALWAEFAQRFVDDEPFEGDPLLDPLTQIFTRHKHSGELSRKSIEATVKKLVSGPYLLMTTHRRPNQLRTREAVAQLFGASHWQGMLWKVIPFEAYPQYARFYPHVTFFKFRIP
jgi:hypothetical protein